MIVVTITPSLDPEGSKVCGARGQMFDAAIGGRNIVTRSVTPFCDAARLLLGEGIDPATRLVMRNAGQNYDALRSTVGIAAKLTVEDGRRFRPWKARERWDSGPPMRLSGVAATLPADSDDPHRGQPRKNAS